MNGHPQPAGQKWSVPRQRKIGWFDRDGSMAQHGLRLRGAMRISSFMRPTRRHGMTLEKPSASEVSCARSYRSVAFNR
jgi:hypothetical protein